MNLRDDLDQLNVKRRRLQQELARAHTAHSEARRMLIDKRGRRELEDATAAHSRVMNVRAYLSDLDRELEVKRRDVEALDREEKTKERAARLAEIEDARESLREEYLAARAAANEALQQHIQAMLKAQEDWNELTREAESLRASGPISRHLIVPRLDPYGRQVDQAFRQTVHALALTLAGERAAYELKDEDHENVIKQRSATA